MGGSPARRRRAAGGLGLGLGLALALLGPGSAPLARRPALQEAAREAPADALERLAVEAEAQLAAEPAALAERYGALESARRAAESSTPGPAAAVLASAHGAAAGLQEALLARSSDAGSAGRAAWHRYMQALHLRAAGSSRAAVDALAAGLGVLPGRGVEAFDLLLFRAELLRSLGDGAGALADAAAAQDIELAQRDAWLASDAANAHRRSGRLAGIRGQVLIELGLPEQAAPWIARERDEAELRAALLPATDGAGARLAGWIHHANLLLAQQRYAAAARFVSSPLDALGDALMRADEAGDAVAAARYEAARAELSLVRLFAQGRLADESGADAEATLKELLALAGSDDAGGRARLVTALRGAELAFRANDAELAGRFASAARDALVALERDREGGASAQEHATVLAVELGVARRRGADQGELRARLAAAGAAFERFLVEWERLPVRTGGIGFLRLGNRRFYLGELVESLLALDGAEAALALLARAQESGARTLRGAGGLERFRAEVLAERGGALFYLPAPGLGHVFAVDRRTVTHARLADDVRLRKLAQDFAAALALPGAEAAAPGTALAGALLPEAIRTRLAEWERVTVLGGDLLGEVAFDALPLASGEPLGLAKAVTHLPSSAAGLALAARAAPTTAPTTGEPAAEYVLVADAVAGDAARERWPELTAAGRLAREAQRLLDAHPQDTALALRAEGATWAAVRGAPLHEAGVLQLLVHGVLDGRRELPATLVLTPDEGDGLVRYEDVLLLAQAPPLVLLTACGSGAGPPRPGDDVAGRLAGAFLARGALVVLEALGDVEVEPTVRLSELLLAELRRPGATPADALRRARRALVDEGRFTAPADHGRLRLVGLGHAPSPLPADMPQAAEWRTAALLAGAVAVLATVLLVLGRRRTTATRGG